jgi:hypothetical protein
MSERYPDGLRLTKSQGRPKVQERLEVVSARVDAFTYQSLVRSAHLQDISVSTLVRRLLIVRLPKA